MKKMKNPLLGTSLVILPPYHLWKVMVDSATLLVLPSQPLTFYQLNLQHL